MPIYRIVLDEEKCSWKGGFVKAAGEAEALEKAKSRILYGRRAEAGEVRVFLKRFSLVAWSIFFVLSFFVVFYLFSYKSEYSKTVELKLPLDSAGPEAFSVYLDYDQCKKGISLDLSGTGGRYIDLKLNKVSFFKLYAGSCGVFHRSRIFFPKELCIPHAVNILKFEPVKNAWFRIENMHVVDSGESSRSVSIGDIKHVLKSTEDVLLLSPQDTSVYEQLRIMLENIPVCSPVLSPNSNCLDKRASALVGRLTKASEEIFCDALFDLHRAMSVGFLLPQGRIESLLTVFPYEGPLRKSVTEILTEFYSDERDDT